MYQNISCKSLNNMRLAHVKHMATHVMSVTLTMGVIGRQASAHAMEMVMCAEGASPSVYTAGLV